VAWHTWAERDSAAIVNKPILLFLYSQRSFWCRDLALRCFHDQALTTEISRLTWPVWVDVDRRPDVFERFSLGGLPSVAFLKPDEAWIAGGVYLDPEDMMDLLRRVSFPFANPKRMASLEIQRTELQRRLDLQARQNPRPQIPLSRDLLARLLDGLKNAVDQGIDVGAEGALALFETRQSVTCPTSWLTSRRDEDGLFFLAAITSDAQVVDREKHLGLNAAMLTTLSVIGQDNQALGLAAVGMGDALLDAFRVEHLFCAGFAGFETSEGRPRDLSLYAGWNALAISGLSALYRTSKLPRFQKAALLAMEAVENRFAREDGLLHHTLNGPSELLLDDQALSARAALDVFEMNREAKYLQLARVLADGMVARFADVSGALRDREETDQPVFPVKDHWLPSGNGVAAQVFLRLSKETGERKYRDAAHHILTSLLGPHIDEAASMGALCRALDMYLPGESAVHQEK
jgi:uncharacterized protein YyaL (SSP411 family)